MEEFSIQFLNWPNHEGRSSLDKTWRQDSCNNEASLSNSDGMACHGLYPRPCVGVGALTEADWNAPGLTANLTILALSVANDELDFFGAPPKKTRII